MASVRELTSSFLNRFRTWNFTVFSLERTQLRSLPGRNPAHRWFRSGQCLPDGSPGDPVFPGKATDR